MKNPIRLSSFALTALLLTGAACGEPTRGPSLALSPSARSFTLPDKGWAAVSFTLTNVGSTTVSIEWRCGERLLAAAEQKTSTGWEQYTDDICLANQMSSPVPLDGGTSRQGSVTIFEPGEYRLFTMVDGHRVVSARFTVDYAK